jgi:hypothetical protein
MILNIDWRIIATRSASSACHGSQGQSASDGTIIHALRLHKGPVCKTATIHPTPRIMSRNGWRHLLSISAGASALWRSGPQSRPGRPPASLPTTTWCCAGRRRDWRPCRCRSRCPSARASTPQPPRIVRRGRPAYRHHSQTPPGRPHQPAAEPAAVAIASRNGVGNAAGMGAAGNRSFVNCAMDAVSQHAGSLTG